MFYCTTTTIFKSLIRQSAQLRELQLGLFRGVSMPAAAMFTDTKRVHRFDTLLSDLVLQPKVGFIGGGNMGQALMKGFVNAGILEPNQILVSDPDLRALEIAKSNGFKATGANDDIYDFCKDGVVILAVKPSTINEALSCLTSSTKVGLIVSILAGVSTKTISRKIPEGCHAPIVRVLPNTPALVGAGASALCRGPNCSVQHVQLVQCLMETVGSCAEVSEDQMDAVCGLSASGPAFVFTIIEGLSDGGVKMGLPRSLATSLAAATVMGAGRMVLDTGKHTGSLKDMVTSPGGTTIAGVHVLEERNVRAAMIAAVEAATKRSEELGRKADIY